MATTQTPFNVRIRATVRMIGVAAIQKKKKIVAGNTAEPSDPFWKAFAMCKSSHRVQAQRYQFQRATSAQMQHRYNIGARSGHHATGAPPSSSATRPGPLLMRHIITTDKTISGLSPSRVCTNGTFSFAEREERPWMRCMNRARAVQSPDQRALSGHRVAVCSSFSSRREKRAKRTSWQDLKGL